MYTTYTKRSVSMNQRGGPTCSIPYVDSWQQYHPSPASSAGSRRKSASPGSGGLEDFWRRTPFRRSMHNFGSGDIRTCPASAVAPKIQEPVRIFLERLHPRNRFVPKLSPVYTTSSRDDCVHLALDGNEHPVEADKTGKTQLSDELLTLVRPSDIWKRERLPRISTRRLCFTSTTLPQLVSDGCDSQEHKPQEAQTW